MKRSGFLKAMSAGAVSLVLPEIRHAAPTSKAKKRPNILYFFPDQHRFDWTGLNESLPVRTPHLDRLAKRGVYFPKAICPSPLCAPSRAALASGKEYGRCGVPNNFTNNYPIEQTTFYTKLRDSGYHVMGCGKFDLRKKSKSWGRDGRQFVDGICYTERWGFSDAVDNSGKWDGYGSYNKGNVCPYYAYLEEHGLAQVMIDDFLARRGKNYENTDPTPLPDEGYVDNFIGRTGLELIDRAPKDSPWFLQVNFNGPHDPMDITKCMKDRWRGVEFPQPNRCKQFSPEKHVDIRQNYTAMIENIDRWLGMYVDVLENSGELDNTIIVFSSDHGEMLGDHNRWAKVVPYQPSVGVPLVIGGPGV
ncbi:sulfatase, partial [Candidatus Latescibacterota bacterium]